MRSPYLHNLRDFFRFASRYTHQKAGGRRGGGGGGYERLQFGSLEILGVLQKMREEGGRDGNRGEGFVPLEGAKLYAMVEIPTLLTLLEIN